MSRFALGVSMFLALTLTACGDASAGDVSLNFKTAGHSGSALQSLRQGLSAELVGTNGTLTLDEVVLIVDEVKLESLEDACEQAGCKGFESGPYLVSLPLDGSSVQAFQEPVPAGTYEELKFEVAPRPERLAETLAAAGFEDWPSEASLYVAGTFHPEGGTEAQPFALYLDGEVKIEMIFPEPLVIDATNDGADLTVEIDPAAWFLEEDGRVTDLTQYATGEVLDFEYKVAMGFTGVEVKLEFGDDDREDEEVDAGEAGDEDTIDGEP